MTILWLCADLLATTKLGVGRWDQGEGLCSKFGLNPNSIFFR